MGASVTANPRQTPQRSKGKRGRERKRRRRRSHSWSVFTLFFQDWAFQKKEVCFLLFFCHIECEMKVEFYYIFIQVVYRFKILLTSTTSEVDKEYHLFSMKKALLVTVSHYLSLTMTWNSNYIIGLELMNEWYSGRYVGNVARTMFGADFLRILLFILPFTPSSLLYSHY
jgi:hypothetical protein